MGNFRKTFFIFALTRDYPQGAKLRAGSLSR